MTPPRLRAASLLLAGVGAVAAAAPASGSELVARQASHVSIRVAHGKAVVSFKQHGTRRHVLLWGGLNAYPHPKGHRSQIELQHRRLFAGGSLGRRYLGGRNGCRPYDGPQLPWLVAACKAPNGSYWAAQSWVRLHKPGTRSSAGPRELRISHWTGPVAKLFFDMDWAHSAHFQHLYGWFSYKGQAVYGLRWTRTGVPLDGYGRNVYIDSLNSHWGSGWRRANGFLSKPFHGQFCYTFWQHNVRGEGTAYRARVAGPGATPDVAFGPVKARPAFDAAKESKADAQQALASRDSKFCKPN